MTNLHSALLYSELKSIKNTIKKKSMITSYYKSFIQENKRVKLLLPDSKNEVLWINKLIFLKDNDAKKMIIFLKKNNIRTDNFWITMNQQPFLKKKFYMKKNPQIIVKIFQKKLCHYLLHHF